MTISREDPRFWDVRTVERRMRKGQLNRKDLDKHLKSLPDIAEKAAAVRVEDVADDDDADEADETSN
jgi:hypothetical protein